MWPWGHLAVGYLCYSAYRRARHGTTPSPRPVLALAVATQAPDLIDKPLAWTVSLLPSGRSLAHSLLVVLPALGLLRWAPTDDRIVDAITIGYLGHLVADAIQPVLAGDFADVGFLGWPVIPPVEYPTAKSFLAHLTAIEMTPWLSIQFLLVAVATGVWIADDVPGFEAGRTLLRAVSDTWSATES